LALWGNRAALSNQIEAIDVDDTKASVLSTSFQSTASAVATPMVQRGGGGGGGYGPNAAATGGRPPLMRGPPRASLNLGGGGPSHEVAVSVPPAQPSGRRRDSMASQATADGVIVNDGTWTQPRRQQLADRNSRRSSHTAASSDYDDSDEAPLERSDLAHRELARSATAPTAAPAVAAAAQQRHAAGAGRPSLDHRPPTTGRASLDHRPPATGLSSLDTSLSEEIVIPMTAASLWPVPPAAPPPGPASTPAPAPAPATVPTAPTAPSAALPGRAVPAQAPPSAASAPEAALTPPPAVGQGSTAALPVARMTSVELPDDPNVFNTFEEREFAHDEYLDRLEELLPEFSTGAGRPATAESATAGAR